MIQIPLQERYNQRAQLTDLPETMVAQAVMKIGLKPQACSIQRLAGGFQHTTFLVDHEGRKHVIKFYSSNPKTARTETDTLRFVVDQQIKAPRPLEYFEVEGRGVVVLEFVPGINLQDSLAISPNPRLFRLAGEELAKIHDITLPRAGFLGPGMRIGTDFENFTAFLGKYIRRVFTAVPAAKLEPEVRNRLLQLVEDRWSWIVNSEITPHLAHCDFNPKNIMVSESGDALTGILDWEFATSGSGYIDIGNFFRFPYDYPPEAEAEFLEGYESVRSLQNNWKEISLLMDLGNMASFMERKEDLPKTFRTARIVIEQTLQHFGY